jgi:hypothetical protein
MTDVAHYVFDTLKAVVGRMVKPLGGEEGSRAFRLSSPETQTTTNDGDVGWARRPPAQVICPTCGSGVRQADSRQDIDCSHCVATFTHESFPELELDYLLCPVCRSRMEHGQRHPEQFDVPEWATCHQCRYHWEFKHSY